MGIFMDCIVITVVILLTIYVELIIRVMLGVG